MDTIGTIASYFNKLAANWPEDKNESNIRDIIVERASFSPQSIILDIGCGKGVMVPHLLKTSPKEIIELDVSDEMIRLGKERFPFPNITHICGDILNADLPSIHYAIIFNAYPHLMDKSALAEKLYNLLISDGTVVIAHSKGKEQINGIHHDDGPCEQISIPLQTPLEEAEKFTPWFTMVDWQDTNDLYFIKLKKVK